MFSYVPFAVQKKQFQKSYSIMLKNIFLFILGFSFILSCKNEPSTSENTRPVAPTDSQPATGGLENLKARALDEDDIFGRVNHSLGVLQKEFQVSNQANPDMGKMNVFVDEKFTLLMRNEVNGDVFDTKVNLKNLNPENGSLRLIPDVELDDLPGFAVSVIDGKEGVERTKNGEIIASNERELKIFMATRENVEKVVPAFVQALNVVHGKY